MLAKRYRFLIAFLLFIAGIINYMDRAALGVAAPFVKQDLNLSPSELGVIFSTFFFGYALFAFVGGQLADLYGPRSVYSWAAASWSVLCMLTGAVTGFAQMFVVRSLFGFAEGPMNSTTNRTLTTWFPREETARTIGFTFSGQTVGSAIAAPVVGLLAIQYGWRVAFVAIGAVGLLWVVAWRLLMTDRPQDNPRVSPEEIALIERSRAVTHLPPSDHARSLKEYLFLPSTLSLGLGMFAVNYTVYIFLSWLPSYLTDGLHMPVKEMALVASIPWACGFVGYVGGGILADALYKRMGDKLTARKITTIVPLAIAGVALIAVNAAPNATVAVGLIALSVLMLTSSVQSCWATIHELVPETRVGGVSGFIHLLSNISGIIGPTATGFAVQYLGGYASAFVIAALIAAAGVIAMTIFVRRPRLPASAAPLDAAKVA
ncbi:Sugar phosphate permease [Methylobacterium phyllostachyos]|uniref:Sugar phosphate permease n=1 Tax=Methylobacterium phyllostachyos TaxID=582672 RepID=A0A1G9REK4_9HYPH|nr:MFS transporter [Methylobacterium phyllostachyos]SDM21611.1 Sugar phosphate permease [Methylobacterium phyllostachyos]